MRNACRNGANAARSTDGSTWCVMCLAYAMAAPGGSGSSASDDSTACHDVGWLAITSSRPGWSSSGRDDR